MSEEEALKTIEELKNYISLKMIDINKPKELTDLLAKSMVAFQVMKNAYNKEKEKNKELEKYDYRKINLDEKNKISSIHFTKEQLDLMNLGIALYVGIPKILADKEDEEIDI